ncbi:MAG: taurine dioxygenase [Alphaproteobacteria bacterium]|nr:MAG: taurine dioxygenase [Alphaproteobacteria bacterium]
MAQAAMDKSSVFEVEHLTPTIGSVIRGIDLARAQTLDEIDFIRQALLDRKVIFFRDQDITTEQHLNFARNFGELEVHPFAPHKDGYPEVLAITHDKDHPGRENTWHSDVTWRLEPSLGSVLRLLEVPDVGGDTLFADMEAAYENLPDEIKERVEGRVAVHDFAHFRKQMKKRGLTPQQIEEMNEKYPMVEHPVIRTHPETGRKSIYVNAAFTQYIKDVDEFESAELLKALYATAATPEYQCRFRWAKNSVAFWDNRSCQHYAASDYWPHRRIAERVTIIGDRPR